MRYLGMLVGHIQALYHRRHASVRRALWLIVAEVVASFDDVPRTRTFVMMVGKSLTGKTTLIEAHSVLRTFARIDSNDLHRRLNRTFEFMRDDTTVSGPAYWERQWLTRWLRKKILRQLLRKGVSIVADSCNLERMRRLEQIWTARSFGYRTIEIWVSCTPDVARERRRAADKARAAHNPPLPPTWIRLGKQQDRHFQKPYSFEADQLQTYQSPDQPIESIIV